MSPSGKRVTLADVAREAGVSVQTASHVLSGNKTVRLPESTRQKVAEAAARVGYRPNRLAQAMKSGKTRVIGIWMPVDRPILTYMRFLQLLNQRARTSGYDLMITGLDATSALTPDGKIPALWPVDGLISIDAGKAIEQLRKDRQNDAVPMAVFGYEEVANGDSVGWKVAEAARQATARLIQKGARRIVHITLDWVLEGFPREQRRRGYSEAMAEAGLEPEFLAVVQDSSSQAEAVVGRYLESNPLPDAYFAFTDPIAVGTARAILATGARIPEDCRLWGFGDFPESEDFKIAISTVRPPLKGIVDQAWDWLIDRMANPTQPGRFVELEMELVERESSI